MAPADTPGKKKRENNYFDVGVQGRKTGITLKDTGVRDEHGMEPLDGIFSSPEKSPQKFGSRGGVATSSSTDMQIQQTSGLEPADVLSVRRLNRTSKTILPPPMGRSPIKTALNSSPRRQSSMGPTSQARNSATTPYRASSHPLVSRLLDFSTDEPRASVEHTPVMSSGRSNRSGRKRRSSVFDIDVSPAPDQEPTHLGSTIEEETMEDEAPQSRINGHHEDNPGLATGNESMQMLQDDEVMGAYSGKSEDLPEVATRTMPKKQGRPRKSGDSILQPEKAAPATISPEAVPNKKRGRAGVKTAISNAAPEETEQSIIERDTGQAPVAKRKGRPARSQLLVAAPVYAPDTTTGSEELSVEDTQPLEDSVIEAPPKKPRGRPARNSRLAVLRDEPSIVENERPGKRARDSSTAPDESKERKRTTKPPPSQRDPNAIITSSQRLTKKLKVPSLPPPSPQKPGQPQSLQRLRQGTPMDDEGTSRTRSGRHSIKPVAWWRGERVDHDYEGGIQTIIRAEDVTPPKRNKKGGRRPKRRMDMIEEEEDEEMKGWEEDPGFLSGPVRTWDPSIGTGVEAADDEQEIAFSAAAIQTRDVAGANFKYAKFLTVPFFGSGLVDLPPGGFKMTKNSRKMQMVFFVHQGKVTVNVAGTEFTISKGGVWHVPRGNNYSINNRTETPARIFFAQGCEVQAEA